MILEVSNEDDKKGELKNGFCKQGMLFMISVKNKKN